MRRTITTVLIASFLLAGCATVRDSRLNPFNWFGRAQPVAVEADPRAANPLIPRRGGLFAASRQRYAERDLTSPIASVTNLTVERVPGGAIVRATGVDQMQGAFNVELVPGNEEELPVDGVLSYTLERQRPEGLRPVGPVQTREVVVARKLTDQQLRGVRTIRVAAAQNALAVRR